MAKQKCPFGHVVRACRRDHLTGMKWLLILMIAGSAVAAASALVRGLMAFYHDAERLKSGENDGELFGVTQNRMMMQRVLFQGIAVMLIALLGLMAASH
ncbi:MAG: hypothetical protein RL367_705 [Pseudomonadota bacterium]|jgi:hypothetical protein